MQGTLQEAKKRFLQCFSIKSFSLILLTDLGDTLTSFSREDLR